MPRRSAASCNRPSPMSFRARKNSVISPNGLAGRTVRASTRRRTSSTASSAMRRPVTSSFLEATTLSEPACRLKASGQVAEVTQMAIDQIRTDEELTALDRSGYHLDDIRRPGAVAEPGLGRGIAKVEVH